MHMNAMPFIYFSDKKRIAGLLHQKTRSIAKASTEGRPALPAGRSVDRYPLESWSG